MAIFIDHRGGTGGGVFRYMYARFLGEVAAITAEPRLAEMGAELKAIGDRWDVVAAAFDMAAYLEKPADWLETATEPMQDIADREQAFWARLATVIAA